MTTFRLALALLAALALPVTAVAQTLQTVTPHTYIGPKVVRDTTTLTTIVLDANGEYVATLFAAPKTGTIDRCHYYATVATSQGDGLRCRIETVDTTNGQCSGTLVASSTEVTIATTAVGWNRSGAGLNAAVTAGTIYCYKRMSPSAGTTTNLTLRHDVGLTGPSVTTSPIFPYHITFVGGSTTKTALAYADAALEYDDGTTPYIENWQPVGTITSTSYSSASTPDERCNLLNLPYPVRARGFYAAVGVGGANINYDLVLYSGTTALKTVSVDADVYRSAAAGYALFPFAVESLSANTDYRICHKPTTGTSSITHWAVDTATGGTRLREMTVGGTSWQLSSRADAGSFSETADLYTGIGLIVDGLSDGVCSGGGGPCVIR